MLEAPWQAQQGAITAVIPVQPPQPYPLYRITTNFSSACSCNSLIDNGAASSFVSTRLITRLDATIVLEDKNTYPVFETASKEIIKTYGCFNISFQLAGLEFDHDFFVSAKMGDDCILCMDFLTKKKIVLDMGNKTLTIPYKDEIKVIHVVEQARGLFNINQPETKKWEFNVSHLKEPLRSRVQALLEEFPSAFGEIYKDIKGGASITPQRIITKGEPFYFRPYKCPIHLRPILKEMLDEMLEAGIIEKACSPFSSPVFLEPKKPPSTKYRLIVDMRELNKMTIKNKHPIPSISDLVQKFAGSKIFSSIDLNSGYHQIVIDKRDRFKTAFSTQFGHFQFARMVMGCSNSPAQFTKLMEEVLESVLERCVVLYVDDLVIHSPNEVQHEADVRTVINLLLNAGLTMKPSKCFWFLTKIIFCGHEISADGVAVDQTKVKAILGMKPPSSADEVRRFLGCTGWFRDHIPKYAEIAHSLTELTKKSIKFYWSNEANIAFETLKEKITTAPVLAYFDPTRPCTIYCDASGVGVGAMMAQKQLVRRQIEGSPKTYKEEEVDLPISFFSRHLTATQQRYPAHELEAYAIVAATKHFHHFLIGSRFLCVTDHKGLECLLNKKELPGRLYRWSIHLSQYQMDIKYRSGKENVVADCLSRAPVMVLDAGHNFKVDDWVADQQRDKFCARIIAKLKTSGDDGIAPTIPAEGRTFREEDGFRFLNQGLLATSQGKVVVPASRREHLLFMSHDHKLGGHLGIKKTYYNLSTKYWWASIRRDVTAYIKACTKCARRKVAKMTKAEMMSIPVDGFLFNRVVLDYIGPLPPSIKGHRHILTILETTSRFGWAFATRDTKASTLINKFIKHIINQEGCPKIVHTDNASYFKGELFTEFCRQLNITHLTSTSFSPMSQGAIEVWNKTLADFLTLAINEDSYNWPEHLHYCVARYNRTKHSSLKDTPFHLIKGRDPLEPTDVRPPMRYRFTDDPNHWFRDRWNFAIELAEANLVLSKEIQKKYYDKNTKPRSFHEGERVLLKIMVPQTGKFYNRYTPPYIIVEKLSEINYLVRKEDSDVCITVHVNRIRPGPTDRVPIGPDEVDEELSFSSTVNENVHNTSRKRVSFAPSDSTEECEITVSEQSPVEVTRVLEATHGAVSDSLSQHQESEGHGSKEKSGLQQQPVVDDVTAPGNATNDLLDPGATTSTDAGKQKQAAAPMAKRGRGRPRKDGGMNATKEKEKTGNVAPSDQSIAQPTKTYELRPRPKRTDKLNYHN